jgi:O-antigen/teichoic acid export membrane protein
MIRSRLKTRWKVLVVLVGIWLLFMFPIPFLPLFGAPIDDTSIRTLIITTAIVSIPFTLLAIFMNEGRQSNGEKNPQ